MSTLRPIRIRLRCSTLQSRQRLARRFAADGVYLSEGLPALVGELLRVTIELREGLPVLSGTARVSVSPDRPKGTLLHFLKIDTGGSLISEPKRERTRVLEETLFEGLPPPEEHSGSIPLVVHTRQVELRLGPA